MNQKFTVTFYHDDRKTILEKQEVDENSSVKYQGKLPEKPAENGREYNFIGWETTGNLENVTQNIDVFAKFEETSKINSMFELSELNAENARLDDVMRSRTKGEWSRKSNKRFKFGTKKRFN